MMEMTIAEPAPRWPASPLMAVPIAAKIPAPMMAPMPSAVSCRGPRERRSPPPISLSATHWSTVFRAKSWDMSLRLFDCRLARDLDRVDAGDRLAVPGASGREPVRLHAPHEVPPTGGILGQRIDLHVGHPAVRRDPEPQLVAAPRRAVGRDNQAFEIGAENVTPFSTRTRAHLAARPGARALPAAGPPASARALGCLRCAGGGGEHLGPHTVGDVHGLDDLGGLAARSGLGGQEHG